MRYLAIDLGDKRTGLAVGDDESGLVSPERVLEIPVAQKDRILDALAAAAADYGAHTLVIGLPLNMDDTEGPRAKGVRALGDALAERTGLPVHYQDERLTSAEADWSMAQSGMTHAQKKRVRDALAAAAILRDFLAR
jgi:putative Holliday junction resolvase